jgi:hypothetical protein
MPRQYRKCLTVWQEPERLVNSRKILAIEGRVSENIGLSAVPEPYDGIGNLPI